MKRVDISGTKSGCGKTTVTCAILSAIKKRDINVSAFKCGPDYIDTMFHRKVLGVQSHNLDSFFCNKDTLLYLLDEYSGDISVIEGVMGFYDGDTGSAYSVSQLTETQTIIVIDCKGMSNSIGAVMNGYLNYRPNHIAGFIFNRLPEKMIPLVKRLCSELGTNYYGCLPKTSIILESRHLGLVTAGEIADIQEKIQQLGLLAEKYIFIDKILDIQNTALPEYRMPTIRKYEKSPIIAVANDKAFCFIYQENIQLLEKMGCRIQYFSPIEDKSVPDCDGLILYGGYPELYAEQLSANDSMLASIKQRIQQGTPTIAECGGFMYLHDSLTDNNGISYRMAGVISGNVFPTDKLQRFGYITLKSEKESMLSKSGENIRAHEFHYWDSTNSGEDYTAEKTDGRTWKCCHSSDCFYAGFPHLYFYTDIKIAERFVEECIKFGERNG